MKKTAEREVKRLNIELEQEVKTEWELDIATQQSPSKRKPQWRFTIKRGKY